MEVFLFHRQAAHMVARGTGSGFKPPPSLFQAMCSWESEETSLGLETFLSRMDVVRLPPSIVEAGLEWSEAYTILEDLTKKKDFNYE